MSHYQSFHRTKTQNIWSDFPRGHLNHNNLVPLELLTRQREHGYLNIGHLHWFLGLGFSGDGDFPLKIMNAKDLPPRERGSSGCPVWPQSVPRLSSVSFRVLSRTHPKDTLSVPSRGHILTDHTCQGHPGPDILSSDRRTMVRDPTKARPPVNLFPPPISAGGRTLGHDRYSGPSRSERDTDIPGVYGFVILILLPALS